MKILSLAAARETCAFCPKLCRHACPTAAVERTEEATPTYKQQTALLAQQGRQPLDSERARLLYKCTDCQSTLTSCRLRVPVATSLRDARAHAVAAGVAPPEVSWLEERFGRWGSPYGRDLRAEAAARDDGGPGADGARAELGLFASCTALAHHPDEVRDALTLLARAGERASLALPNPICCGYPLDAAGLAPAFRRQAHRVAVALSGYERLVSLSPTCAYTLSIRYPAVGVPSPLRADPISDVLAACTDRWEAAAPAAPDERRYAYHDPCSLGRRLGRYDEPRAALTAALGRPPVELGYAREASLCSGGGGVYPLTHPERAADCATRVLGLFRESGADVLVTACPSARRRFTQADPTVAVQSLVGVVAERTRPAGRS